MTMKVDTANHIDIGDGISVSVDPGRKWVGSDHVGAAYVYMHGNYCFTCADLDEARSMKPRLIAQKPFSADA